VFDMSISNPTSEEHMYMQMAKYGIDAVNLYEFKAWVREHFAREHKAFVALCDNKNKVIERPVPADFGEHLCSQYAEVLEEQDRVFCDVCGVSYNKEDPCLYH